MIVNVRFPLLYSRTITPPGFGGYKYCPTKKHSTKIVRGSKLKKYKGGEMESAIRSSDNYQINFFKPISYFLKDDVRAIVICIAIWGVAAFCFRILLYRIFPAL